MDSRIGLDYIVENSDYADKLGVALDTHNQTVKKQVFELLSALCAYSPEGYARAVQTLEHYKNLKGERYRLNIVVVELDKTTTLEYQVTLLAFINCIIISTRDLQDRIRVRNEFIGLNLLSVLNNLRRTASSKQDLAVQLDVFDEQRECDESQSLQGPDGINLSSHLDVFYAILRQVADTPQEIPFLSILQHLLRIDPKEAISDIIWDTAETLVHRATLLENKEDSSRLLRAPSIQKFTCPHCRCDITSPNRKQSLAPTTPIIIQSPPPPPPPPAFGGQGAAAPPPPPPPAFNSGGGAPPPPPPMKGSGPPAPPAPPGANGLIPPSMANRPKTPDMTMEQLKSLPQQETPVPKSKMKTINWNKIPPNKVVGRHNIWAIVADSHQNSPMADLNWDEMEGLFCQQPTHGSPKLGRDADTVDSRKPTKKDNEITLLDGKRSLNVNIFLKQFRGSNKDIIQSLQDGTHEDIGSEKLRGLLKILPEVDELDNLKSFEGDKNRLGTAEKFLMQLIQVSNYKLRIESMLLKEEFESNLAYLDPSIQTLLDAGKDLLTNKLLQEVLYMVVVAGNFLNSGGYAGNAAGVKLSSLQKLTDIRANKPGMNLIHFVAIQAEKKNQKLLLLTEQMRSLDSASKITVDQLNNEISMLATRIKKITQQIEMPMTDQDIKEQMTEFLIHADNSVTILQRDMKQLEALRLQLADFFCEDPGTFKMEECYKIFQNFCEKFRLAVQENDKRRIQEEQVTMRKKMREEQNNKRRLNQAGTPVSDSENSFLMDPADIRCSPAFSRRRFGSFNSNGDANFNRDDGMSPDITPNGSLRRRRSRVLSEEDETGLMSFLNAAGHDNVNRERKGSSYGSLDRSWARRARSGSGSKKRPDLLNVDFGNDRERPSSPSPLAESKPLPTEENKPREWRQKIESWLQANEQDEKQNDEYKKKMRRVTSNRRSLETDTESERSSKLDPLPEEREKLSVTSPEPQKRGHEWKPSMTLDNTDVVKTIEALAEAQPKDKSAVRKSNLNVSNSSEETESENRRFRRQKSRESATPSTTLQSIVEEDKRKNYIQSLGERLPTDKLQIYIRRPSDDVRGQSKEETATVKSPGISDASDSKNKQSIYIRPLSTPEPVSKQSIYVRGSDSTLMGSGGTGASLRNVLDTVETPNVPKRIRRPIAQDEQTNNKIEIDSDNIETPPSERKTFKTENKGATNLVRRVNRWQPITVEQPSVGASVSKTPLNTSESNEFALAENENLGDGQFDRYASARKTRRFKRPTDHSSSTEEKSITSPESPVAETKNLSLIQKVGDSASVADAAHSPVKEKDNKIKRWPERLGNKPPINSASEASESAPKNDVVSRIEKIGRKISRISQEDVREAIRSLKSPTPEREWSANKEFRDISTPFKAITHELNDEGFEETQSLVSDTPSHGKDSTSSCNENSDKNKRIKPRRLISSDSAATTGSDSSRRKSSTNKPLPQLQGLLSKNQQSLERSKSMRGTPPVIVNRNLLPKRTNSLRRIDSPINSSAINANRLDVERSNSRTSLRSSRSSINSAVSTNTVKKMPLRSQQPAISVSSPLTVQTKRPLVTQNSPTKTAVRVPASRSSSSGSSIGPTITKKPPVRVSSTVNTSFKENQHSTTNRIARTAPQKSITSSTSNLSSNPITRNHLASKTIGNRNSAPSGAATGNTTTPVRTSSFMRPTTASTTKVKKF